MIEIYTNLKIDIKYKLYIKLQAHYDQALIMAVTPKKHIAIQITNNTMPTQTPLINHRVNVISIPHSSSWKHKSNKSSVHIFSATIIDIINVTTIVMIAKHAINPVNKVLLKSLSKQAQHHAKHPMTTTRIPPAIKKSVTT